MVHRLLILLLGINIFTGWGFWGGLAEVYPLGTLERDTEPEVLSVYFGGRSQSVSLWLRCEGGLGHYLVITEAVRMLANSGTQNHPIIEIPIYNAKITWTNTTTHHFHPPYLTLFFIIARTLPEKPQYMSHVCNLNGTKWEEFLTFCATSFANSRYNPSKIWYPHVYIPIQPLRK